MFEFIKKHPVALSAAALGAVVLYKIGKSSGSADAAAGGDYASGTTIVGTPNPLGGVQLAQGSTGAGSTPDFTGFFQSQTDQAKAAQLTAQTAALSSTNLDTLTRLLKTVGKGQDATFQYNALGQVSGVTKTPTATPSTSLVKQTQDAARAYALKLQANLKALKSGAKSLPFPDVQVAA